MSTITTKGTGRDELMQKNVQSSQQNQQPHRQDQKQHGQQAPYGKPSERDKHSQTGTSQNPNKHFDSNKRI